MKTHKECLGNRVVWCFAAAIAARDSFSRYRTFRRRYVHWCGKT